MSHTHSGVMLEAAPCQTDQLVLQVVDLRHAAAAEEAYLDVFNTTDYVNPSSVSMLFDRFYRGDSSRSRDTGGYGIGLSIASAIVDRHKGKIKAIANGTKEITFRVTL